MYCVVFSFKLDTDSFIRSIYYNICLLISMLFCFRKSINWESKGNFKNLL